MGAAAAVRTPGYCTAPTRPPAPNSRGAASPASAAPCPSPRKRGEGRGQNRSGELPLPAGGERVGVRGAAATLNSPCFHSILWTIRIGWTAGAGSERCRFAITGERGAAGGAAKPWGAPRLRPPAQSPREILLQNALQMQQNGPEIRSIIGCFDEPVR